MPSLIARVFRQRALLLWSLIALAAILVVIGGAALLVQHFRHAVKTDSPLWSVSFSPDSRRVVAAGGKGPRSVGELVLWEIGQRSKRIVREPATTRSVAWSPNGKFVATGDFAGVTKLIDPSSGETLFPFSPPAQRVNAVAVSADGGLVASATFDGTIDLWDSGTGKEQQVLVIPAEHLLWVAFSPDARRLVATTRSGKGLLFDLAQKGEPVVLQAYAGPPAVDPGVECAAFSPDGKVIATGSMTTMRVWDTQTMALKQEIAASANFNNVAFSPDGEKVASIHADGRLVVWDAKSGAEVNSTQAHPKEAFGLSFAPDGKRIATVSRSDFTIKIWNAGTLQLEQSLRLH
jgi:WD40 repeat protein